MELYYKDLISEEASLEKLVDDLMLLVQGGDESDGTAGGHLLKHKREEIKTRLERLKERCRQLKHQAVAGAHATDRLLKQHPYSSLGFAFALGMLAGALLNRRHKD
jgi:ElaB/YqjD/DUF883 family membrane-anchored ribosome-binding protein